jgi:hypothetical protein
MTYEKRLNKGENDKAEVIEDRCSICGYKFNSDQTMTGYYERKEHFMTHDLIEDEARYSALKETDTPIVESALIAFAKTIKPRNK